MRLIDRLRGMFGIEASARAPESSRATFRLPGEHVNDQPAVVKFGAVRERGKWYGLIKLGDEQPFATAEGFASKELATAAAVDLFRREIDTEGHSR